LSPLAAVLARSRCTSAGRASGAGLADSVILFSREMRAFPSWHRVLFFSRTASGLGGQAVWLRCGPLYCRFSFSFGLPLSEVQRGSFECCAFSPLESNVTLQDDGFRCGCRAVLLLFSTAERFASLLPVLGKWRFDNSFDVTKVSLPLRKLTGKRFFFFFLPPQLLFLRPEWFSQSFGSILRARLSSSSERFLRGSIFGGKVFHGHPFSGHKNGRAVLPPDGFLFFSTSPSFYGGWERPLLPVKNDSRAFSFFFFSGPEARGGLFFFFVRWLPFSFSRGGARGLFSRLP